MAEPTTLKPIAGSRRTAGAAIRQLQLDLEAVIDAFVEQNGDMPSAAVIGVMQVLQYNLIARLDKE